MQHFSLHILPGCQKGEQSMKGYRLKYKLLYMSLFLWKGTELMVWLWKSSQLEDKVQGPVVQSLDNAIQWINTTKTYWVIQWIVLSTLWTTGTRAIYPDIYLSFLGPTHRIEPIQGHRKTLTRANAQEDVTLLERLIAYSVIVAKLD